MNIADKRNLFDNDKIVNSFQNTNTLCFPDLDDTITHSIYNVILFLRSASEPLDYYPKMALTLLVRAANY